MTQKPFSRLFSSEPISCRKPISSGRFSGGKPAVSICRSQRLRPAGCVLKEGRLVICPVVIHAVGLAGRQYFLQAERRALPVPVANRFFLLSHRNVPAEGTLFHSFPVNS